MNTRIDFFIQNQSGVNLTFELFNAINCFATVTNPAYAVPGFDYKAFPSVLTSGTPVTSPPYGVVTFGENGDIFILDNTGAQRGIINCISYPYRHLIEDMKDMLITIHKIRFNVSNAAQLIQPITRFENTPLTRITKEITYNPTINPNNVSPTKNDFIQEININPNTGLKWVQLAGTISSLTMEATIKKTFL